jgi:hypothetical protein
VVGAALSYPLPRTLGGIGILVAMLISYGYACRRREGWLRVASSFPRRPPRSHAYHRTMETLIGIGMAMLVSLVQLLGVKLPTLSGIVPATTGASVLRSLRSIGTPSNLPVTRSKRVSLRARE